MNRTLKHLPPDFAEILEYREIDRVASAEFDNLEADIDKLVSDKVLSEADEQAIFLYEKELNIVALPDESLEFRRLRIANRWQTKPPFTKRYLQQALDRLTGEGVTMVEVDGPNFKLTVTVGVDDTPIFREVAYTVNKVKPANISYIQNTAIAQIITIQENISRRPLTFNYKLNGSWSLGSLPFGSLGTEVIVK